MTLTTTERGTLAVGGPALRQLAALRETLDTVAAAVIGLRKFGAALNGSPDDRGDQR